MSEVAEAGKTLKLDKSTWQLTKLGALAKDISKRVDNPADSDYDRFVGLEHFISGDIKIKNWGSTENLTSSTKAFQAGDILFARRNAYLRRASLVDFEGCCSGDAFVLREDHEKVHPGFLAFLMNSNALWDYANSNAAGTMSKRVKWRDLAEYEFLLPPKEQQVQLAELLWAMDEEAEQLFALKDNQEILTKRILKDLFEKQWNDSHPFLGKYKFTEFPNLKFNDICEESMFGPRFSSKLYDENGNIACLRTTDMFDDGEINLETMPKAIIPENKFHEHYLKEGDLLISRSGTCGLTGVFSGYSLPVLPAAFLIRFRIKNGFDPYYLRAFFNSDIGKQITSSLSTGAVQKNLTSTALLQVSIPIPQYEIQKAILDMIAQISISEVRSKITSSKALQKSLINQIF